MTQPSQMGNFKHQSLRGPDRDRDRDLRDKEGHEHLRNVRFLSYDFNAIPNLCLSSLTSLTVIDLGQTTVPKTETPHLTFPQRGLLASSDQASLTVRHQSVRMRARKMIGDVVRKSHSRRMFTYTPNQSTTEGHEMTVSITHLPHSGFMLIHPFRLRYHPQRS